MKIDKFELQKQRKIRFLSLTDDGKKIDSYTYSKLIKCYKNSGLIPLDIDEVDSSNLLQLIKNYPCFFSFLRENIIIPYCRNNPEQADRILNKFISDGQRKQH